MIEDEVMSDDVKIELRKFIDFLDEEMIDNPSQELADLSNLLEDIHEKWNKTELKNIPEVVKAKDDKKKLLEEAKVETN